MSSSLAEQLKKLALPQTAALKRNDKKRASILFDVKEAANISKETLYQIGFDGLEELKNKNPVFATFDSTLFNMTAKNFERSVQTAQANEKLDKNLRRFFHLLSPYFLMNAAHKTLEWLVYRYQIHEYNKDDLILLILPYHDTNIFVRILQIITIRDNDRWSWLKPLQKPGIHLSKNILYNHAASNPGFVQLVSDNLLAAIQEHERPYSLTVFFNFYCATFTGCIQHMKDIDEAHIVQLLPSILKGLKSDIPDFAASAYIILSQLLTKVTLSDKVLDLLMEKLSELNVAQLTSEALLVMIVLYQSQENYKQFPSKAVANFSANKQFTTSLQDIANSGYYVDTLLKRILTASLTIAIDEVSTSRGKTIINDLMKTFTLEEGLIHQIFEVVTTSYNCKTSYPKETVQWLKSFVETIERQYPAIFDKEVSRIMKQNSPQRQVFEHIVQHVNLHNQVDLFEKLYHPEPTMRTVAMRKLLKHYGTMKSRDREFIRNVFLDRLNDDDEQVVIETLEVAPKILLEVMDSKEYAQVLLKVLYKYKSDTVTWLALEALLKIDGIHDDYEVLVAILPLLHPLNEGFYKCTSLLIEKFIPRSKTLQCLFEVLKGQNLKNIFNIVLANLKLLKFDVNLLIETERNSLNSQYSLFKYSLALIFCKTSTAFDPRVTELLIENLEIKNAKPTSVSKSSKRKEKNVQLNLLIARNDLPPLEGYLECLENFICKCPKANLNVYDLCSNNDEITRTYLLLTNVLLSGAFHEDSIIQDAYAKAFKVFLNVFAPNREVEFLLNYASTDNLAISVGHKLRAVKSAHSLLHKQKFNLTDSNIVPYLLACLQNPTKHIRDVVIQCFNELLMQNLKNDYSQLVKAIVSCQTEISLDVDQLPLALFNNQSKCMSCFNSLSEKLSDKLPISLKSCIIQAFKELNDRNLYLRSIKFAQTILADKIFQSVNIVTECIEQFTEEIAAVTEPDNEVWTFIEAVLKEDHATNEHASLSSMFVNKLNKEIYNQFSPNCQKALIDIIVERTTYSVNPEMLPATSKLFKHIDLDACTILPLLEKMRDVVSPKVQTKLRRRINVVPTIDILDMSEWKKGVTVLEFVQEKKKMRNIEKLIPILFEILKKCLDFDEQSNVEYPKQLTLSSILHYCDKIDPNVLPQNVFNMELVVQCIRASQNPQTHHHALLLLAKVASFIPEQVLLHIMAIFTFMGSSVLRHDDAYSFQIIAKIIETIIPILVKEKSQQDIINVLRVFVDVILDVPEHRRMPLYGHLLQQIGPMDNLHLFLLLIFESHVLSKTTSGNKRLEIAKSLSLQFAPEIVIHSSIRLVKHVKSLPIEKESYQARPHDNVIFDIANNTPKQLRHYKYVLVHFTSTLLASKEFVNKVARLSDEENRQLEEFYKKMIVDVLTYVQATTKVVEQNANTPQSQYWKVMLHHTYDILDSLNALLTSKMFLLVIKGLLTHQLNTVKRRALELLNSKLQQPNSEFFNECEESDLIAMIPPLIVIIKDVEKESLDSDEEIIIQLALFSLKLFVRLLAADNTHKFIPILKFITVLITSRSEDGNILATAVLCLAELCSKLRSHAITSLNNFMPTIIKILKAQGKEEYPTLLLVSTVAALQKILDVLALFLSPYLEKLLYEICKLSAKWQGDDTKTGQFLSKMNGIREKMGSAIPARVLIPTMNATYKLIVDRKQYPAIGSLMDVLAEHLKHLNGAELQQNLPELSTFFMHALEFRTESQVSLEMINEIESHVIKAITTLILKLSESSFRPFYYKLYDWAVRSQEMKSERVISFYALSHAIANALKGLFVLFAGHFISNAASVIEACNLSKTEQLYFDGDEIKSTQLLENALKTLNMVFIHDNQKFINKERFDVLMQVIVDQLDNTLGDYQKRVREIVIPVIVNFTVATADDALWKQLNYQILLKMRDANPHVRMLALECLRDICKKVGEDFLPLLPETIPFLAELLEDEEEQIEKACQKTIQELEKVLGEPLQKYF